MKGSERCGNTEEEKRNKGKGREGKGREGKGREMIKRREGASRPWRPLH